MQSSLPFARIGTRGSPLALAQARLVRELLAQAHGVAEDRIEIEVFSTGGDRSQAENTTLSDIGGKGVFTKEIDEALLAGRIDLGVHSSKDVATGLPAGMVLAAFLEREDVRDAFLSFSVKGIDNLPEGARFGTSSIRRAAQALSPSPSAPRGIQGSIALPLHDTLRIAIGTSVDSRRRRAKKYATAEKSPACAVSARVHSPPAISRSGCHE